MANVDGKVERRSSRRYPIEREVQFRARDSSTNLTGTGITLNMSSDGVLFTTNRTLPEGLSLTLEVRWPVLLGKSKPLKLVTRGKVIRSNNSRAALQIENWEFRTQGGSRPLPGL